LTIAGTTFGGAHAEDSDLLTADWRMGDGATLRLLANLSAGEIAREQSETTGTPIWGDSTSGLVPPWSVFWRLEAR